MKIFFLKATYGDCIRICFPDTAGHIKNILIDGGTADTYQVDKGSKGRTEDGDLKDLVADLRRNDQKIDLLIITHVDDDHIGGILKWFEQDPEAHGLIVEVWFNSGKIIATTLKAKENPDLKSWIRPVTGPQTSIAQGIEFANYIQGYNKGNREAILQGDVLKRFGLTFKILSPSKPKLELLLRNWKKKDPDLKTATALDDYRKSLLEHIAQDKYTQDGAYPNGSSIAFILVYGSKNLLFLGDAHPSVIVKGLKIFNYTPQHPLNAELVKLAHHGSKGNNSVKLFNCLESANYVISSDGSVSQHPHKQLLARLINLKRNARLIFNYKRRMEAIFTDQDKKDFPDFELVYAEKPLEIQP